MTDLRAVLTRFEDAHDRLQALKDETKEAQVAYDKLRKSEVLDALKSAGILDDEGKGSCTTPSGRKLYVTTDTRAYILQEDMVETYAAIKEMGFGELLRETIHPSTLTAWVRDRLENAEALPPGVRLYVEDKAVLRKS